MSRSRRRTRRRRKGDARRAWLFEAMFFGLWAILAAFAYILNDFYGVQFRWAGSYLWGMAFFFGFSLYLLYLLQFVLPLSWYLSVWEGLTLIFAPTFPYVSKVTRILFGGSSGAAAGEELLRELPPSFRQYRAGILPSYQALALTRGPRYVRPVGPGYVHLARGETVAQVVDLRGQTRSLPVKAMTRDGIPVETTVNVRFQVKMRTSPFGTTLPYPYDSEAIFGVNYLSNYRAESGILDWGDRIVRMAESILIGELAQYALDEMYQPEQMVFSPRKRIADRMMQKLEAEFETKGVTILGVDAGLLKVPVEVVDQLISNWQTEWQRRINEVEAATETAAMQRIRLAQARAEIEIIATITENIETMQSRGEGQLTDIVTVRTLEAMSEAAEDEQVKALVPSHAFDTMDQLQEWLQDWDSTDS